MSKISRKSIPKSEAANKRTRINKYCAVITDESYTDLVADLSKDKSKAKRPALAKASHKEAATYDVGNVNVDPMTIFVNNYVLLRVHPARKNSKPTFFVGYVVSAEPARMWRIQSMQRHGSAMNKFTFEEDVELYCSDEIVKVLGSDPHVSGNGVYTFKMTFRSFRDLCVNHYNFIHVVMFT
jgi:hypothetical protein